MGFPSTIKLVALLVVMLGLAGFKILRWHQSPARRRKQAIKRLKKTREELIKAMKLRGVNNDKAKKILDDIIDRLDVSKHHRL